MFSKNKQNKLRLCNISFKINILNFPRVLPPWSPNEPNDGLTVPPYSQLHFISQFMQNPECFSFLPNPVCL